MIDRGRITPGDLRVGERHHEIPAQLPTRCATRPGKVGAKLGTLRYANTIRFEEFGTGSSGCLSDRFSCRQPLAAPVSGLFNAFRGFLARITHLRQLLDLMGIIFAYLIRFRIGFYVLMLEIGRGIGALIISHFNVVGHVRCLVP